MLFCLGAIVIGAVVGSRSLTQAQMASGEAATAERILATAGFQEPAAEAVLVQSPTLRAGDARFSTVVSQVVARVSADRQVTGVLNPLTAPAAQVSRDGHSALVQFQIRGDRDKAKDRVAPILDSVTALQKAHPDFRVEEFGFASANHALAQTMTQDLGRAERASLPVTLLILFLAFGALVAAGLPVALGFSAALAAMGLSEVVSHLVPTADATRSVILLVGMAVGVDYSLFYLRREREERARGREPRAALLGAAATSGQAVLISGTTVLIAMAGMFLAGNGVFTSIALGAMVVVAVAMVGSLSVLPALLSKLGDRVDRGRLPVLASRRRPVGESRLWSVLLRPALAHPAVAVTLGVATLVVAAIPVLGMHTKLSSFTDLPHSLPIVRSYNDIQAAFPGAQTPAEVVVQAKDVTTPAFQAAYAEGQRRALATGVLFQPFHVFVNPAKTVARIEFPIAGNGDNAASQRALAVLRSQVIAPLARTLPGVTVAVSGETAGTHDFNQTMKERAPLVFGFVLALAFLLLLLTFHSIVIPLTAILLNLLSVGAAYGVLIMVFQHGHLSSLLGFRSNGAVVAWLPLFLFVILFGLSMDYHVFIVSRIKELVDQGMPTGQAVERGILTTASTVTSAAVVMVGVFAIFGGLRELDIKQMGFGLGVAVFIDATLIRAVLLPASMKLLGERNWYLPKRLAWLPRLRFETSVTTDTHLGGSPAG